jgi:hypothetical protein
VKGSDMNHLKYVSGTGWSEAHDPEGNMPIIDDAITAIDTGYVGQARLIFTAQPAANDTIGIGADFYEFDGIGAVNINVAILGSAALTRVSFINAINRLGTAHVFAESDVTTATTIVIYNADAPGGNKVVGTQSIALTESITNAADIWNGTNLNQLGREPFAGQTSGTIVINAVNVLTPIIFTLPFTPTEVVWFAKSTAGVILHACSATFVISTGHLVLTPTAGASPLLSTDVVYWVARG